MSQPPSTATPNGTTAYKSALQEYHERSAAGYFTPSVSTTISPTPPPPPTNLPHGNIQTSAAPHQTSRTLSLVATATGPPASTSSPYGALPSTPRITISGHLPNLLPRPSHGPSTPYQPPPPPPSQDSIIRESISIRLQNLLQQHLPSWISPNIVLLSTSLTEQIILLSKNGCLGPKSLPSVDEIFMVVGHEGKWHYMALAMMAPMNLKVQFRGASFFLDGRDPLKDKGSMEILRSGFADACVREWVRASELIGRGSLMRR